MRRTVLGGLAGLASLLLLVSPALARDGRHSRHSRGGASFGFHFFVPFYPRGYVVPYPYYPSYPYYPPHYYTPAPPPVYYYAPPPQIPQEIGYLQLEIEPGDAHVYLNGRYLGPVQQFAQGGVPLAPGNHQVAIVAWGHRPFQREVQIAPGQTFIFRLTLERDPTAPLPPPPPQGGTQGGGYQVVPRE